MIDLKKLQKEVHQNKLNKGFNVTDINLEFCYIYEELAEAYQAHRKGLENVGEEIADVCIYLLGLSEILKIDMEMEILKKIEVNKNRQFKNVKGKWVRLEKGKKPKVVATSKWVKTNVKKS